MMSSGLRGLSIFGEMNGMVMAEVGSWVGVWCWVMRLMNSGLLWVSD
jgi:hypothetical protein